MDARINLWDLFHLGLGDAHVIRNAGGVITDDEVRSLAISQRLLGTEEIVLIHHTDCGMLTFTDDEFKASIQTETGIKPEWAAEAFPDVDEDVRQSLARVHASPFIPLKDNVRGFVYEVETGVLREVAKQLSSLSLKCGGAQQTSAAAPCVRSMELRGLEPLTSAMPWRRSPS